MIYMAVLYLLMECIKMANQLTQNQNHKQIELTFYSLIKGDFKTKKVNNARLKRHWE